MCFLKSRGWYHVHAKKRMFAADFQDLKEKMYYTGVECSGEEISVFVL